MTRHSSLRTIGTGGAIQRRSQGWFWQTLPESLRHAVVRAARKVGRARRVVAALIARQYLAEGSTRALYRPRFFRRARTALDTRSGRYRILDRFVAEMRRELEGAPQFNVHRLAYHYLSDPRLQNRMAPADAARRIVRRAAR